MRKGEEVRVQRKERIPSPSQTQSLPDVSISGNFAELFRPVPHFIFSFHFLSSKSKKE